MKTQTEKQYLKMRLIDTTGIKHERIIKRLAQIEFEELPKPTITKGSAKFNINLLKMANFVYEGFNRNRFLRYNGEKKTYKEVIGIGIKNARDIRTHNIDLINNTIFIENNNSKEQLLTYATKEDALKVFLFIVGKQNKKYIESKDQYTGEYFNVKNS